MTQLVQSSESLQPAAKEAVLFCWSGGKDSALALYELQTSQRYEVVSLLTTVTRDFDRISMHGVRRTLLHQQAAALGLPLEEVVISAGADNAEYEAQMHTALAAHHQNGIRSVVFGDIFLEDVRQYREKNLQKLGMQGLFPLWQRDSTELVQRFIDLGFKSRLCCVDGRVLDKSFAGRLIDEQFVKDLPAGVDPCGENGEFHSFVFDGPPFSHEIGLTTGEIVAKGSFFFCDLVPI